MHVDDTPDFEIVFGLYRFEFSNSPPALLQTYPVAFVREGDAL
jgi:hypothetical protein